MQKAPAGWTAIFDDSQHRVEYQYVINGIVYSASEIRGTPVIDRPLMREPVIGRCCSGTFSVNVMPRTGVTIPKAATVIPRCRLYTRDGSQTTAWVDLGHYWISNRSMRGSVLALNCRDGMMLAGQSYTDKTKYTSWPVAMSLVVAEIASLMGVEIDPRTVIRAGNDYVVEYPNDDVIMTEILQSVAAAHGANWIMTPEGKLLLLPYPKANTPVQVLGTSFSSFVPLSTSEQTISRVTLTDPANSMFSFGNDNGIEVASACAYATANIVKAVAGGFYVSSNTLHVPNGSVSKKALHLAEGNAAKNGVVIPSTGLIGKSFLPFEINGAYLNPLVELGDTIRIKTRKGAVHDVIANSMRMNLTSFFTVSFANGVAEDDEDEYPYIRVADLQQKRYLMAGQSYMGNRIDRINGFTSEQVLDGVPVARTITNANRFSMQRYNNGQWEDCIYFDPVAGQYRLSGSVKIDSGAESASGVTLSCNSISVAAAVDGTVIGNHNIQCRVIAYTGKNKVIPTVTGVSGQPAGMTVAVQESPVDDERIINISIPSGVTLGSEASNNGLLKVYVSSPISITLEIAWCKINTGANGQSVSGTSTATINLYKRSEGKPTQPGEAVYTFATGALTGNLNGWTKGVPEGEADCYVTTASVISKEESATIPATAWTAPVVCSSVGADGKTTYLHIRYAPNDNPKDNEMSATPDTYIGMYTDFAQKDSTSAADYAPWRKFSGNDGKSGTNNATLYLYKRSTSSPAVPSKAGVYTFSTGEYSGDMEGWSLYIPSGDDQCWITVARLSAKTDTTTVVTGDWSTPAVIAHNGTDGKNGTNTASVNLYQRSASGAPALPSVYTLYYFATGQLFGDVGGWKRSIPDGSDPCYTTSMTAISSSDYLPIPASAWSGAIKLVENGAPGKDGEAGADGAPGKDGTNGKDGKDGTNGTSTAIIYLYQRAENEPATPTTNTVYTFATGAITGTIGSWSQNIPNTNGLPCWVTMAQAVGTTSMVLIEPSKWSTPAKLVEDGEAGAKTYCQPTAPTDAKEQDLWIDSDDNYKLYRYDGSSWVCVQDHNIPSIIEQLTACNTAFDVLSRSIEGTVSETFVTNKLDELVKTLDSTVKQTSEELQLTFQKTVQSATNGLDTKYSTMIRASGDGVEIGKADSNFRTLLSNDKLSFLQYDGSVSTEVAYISNQRLYITDAQIINELAIGAAGKNAFVWRKTSNGLSLRYVSATT